MFRFGVWLLKNPAVVVFPLIFVLVLTVFSRSLWAVRDDRPADDLGGVGGLSYVKPLARAEDPAIPAAGAADAVAVSLLAADPAALAAQGEAEPLEYSRPRMLLYTAYTMVRGDTIGEIAMNYGLSQDTLISLNNVRNTRLLQIGQVLKIPNQDGILYQVRAGDNLEKIAERYQVEAASIRTANELFSARINAGTSLFIPGARLNYVDLQEINGDLFAWPIRGYITSRYGYRANPFGGPRQFHSGLDIGASMGAPVRAAMAGRVTTVSYNEVLGQYIVISHHSNYRSLYGHLSYVRVKPGALVRTGDRIGDVGSTGLSTGPHLHFTVYKNGVTTNPAALMH
jgi:murein DD-endopeptidase MepM/ murein hydrolase activator NlpD